MEFAGSHSESAVWPELDPQLADSHASAPHMSLYSLTVGSPPFRNRARPRPHLPWGTGNDGYDPFQTTGEIFVCAGLESGQSPRSDVSSHMQRAGGM